MSAAGQANEAGSVFRREAAVYFAVHALAGIPVAALDSSRQVVLIDFESADPTDDIVLGLATDAKGVRVGEEPGQLRELVAYSLSRSAATAEGL